MPPVYPRPYGRGISRAAPGMFFWVGVRRRAHSLLWPFIPRAHTSKYCPLNFFKKTLGYTNKDTQ